MKEREGGKNKIPEGKKNTLRELVIAEL